MCAKLAAMVLLLAGLAGCAPATDWSALAVAPSIQPDVRVPGASGPPLDRPPATVRTDGFSQCEAASQAAEVREQTPAGLLAAIARVESGRPDPHTHAIRPWPWSIDVDGEARVFADRDQAVAGVTQALAAGASFIDVGCMQVNLQFHPHAFRSLQEAFDPMANTAYAARFLKALWAATDHQWMVAVGYYHSRTPDLAAAYRRHVQGLGGAACQPAAAGDGSLVLRPPDPLMVAVGTVLAAPIPARPPPCPAVDAGHRG